MTESVSVIPAPAVKVSVALPASTPVISTVLPLTSTVALPSADEAAVTVVVAFGGVNVNGTVTFLPSSTVAVSAPAVMAVECTVGAEVAKTTALAKSD